MGKCGTEGLRNIGFRVHKNQKRGCSKGEHLNYLQDGKYFDGNNTGIKWTEKPVRFG